MIESKAEERTRKIESKAEERTRKIKPKPEKIQKDKGKNQNNR